MNRRSFLKRAGAVAVAIPFMQRDLLGGLVDEPTAAASPAIADTSIVSTGGFCVPMTPYYRLTMADTRHSPFRDALPTFRVV